MPPSYTNTLRTFCAVMRKKAIVIAGVEQERNAFFGSVGSEIVNDIHRSAENIRAGRYEGHANELTEDLLNMHWIRTAMSGA